MAKNKQKSLFMMLLLAVMLLSMVYAASTPIVNAAELSAQDKALSALRNVVGINTEEYNVVQSSQLANQYLSLPQKEADIYLVSEKGGVRAACSFVNNILRKIYLSDYEGELALKKEATATADMAKGFLQRYQNYTGDTFYSELAAMLENIDITRNVTKFAGNIKLEVLNSDDTILDYIWTYTDENGVVAKSKNVILSYDRGQLKVFLNNWPLYKVADTPKISAEEATAIAIDASKKFSYQVTTDNGTVQTVSEFEIAPESLGQAKLSYVNFPKQSLAREGDPFTLYPSWYVPLGFDRIYPGAVTGITVTIWADTGEVSAIDTMVVNIPSSRPSVKEASASFEEAAATEEFSKETTTSASVLAVAIFSAVGIALISVKKAKSAGSRKLFSLFWVTLLFGILMFSLIFVDVPAVNASSVIPNSRARIYAALNSNPPQLLEEQQAANWVCGQIESAFLSSGYITSNHCGSGTIKSAVLSYAQTDQQNYDRVAIFHFGHLGGGTFNNGYQDNNAIDITAGEIAQRVNSHKYAFVFIWVCTQAQTHNSGTPVAWTYRSDLSNDGYLNPDSGSQCYIGFEGISPQIGNETRTFQEQITLSAKWFIKYFYDYALRGSRSVRDALNLASIDFFQQPYTSSIFRSDYHAWWSGGVPGLPSAGWIQGKMKVYGNGAIWLFQPKITLSANYGLSPTFYFDGTPFSIGDVYVWAPKTYTISVSDVPNYIFSHFSYNGMNLGRPANIQLLQTGTLTAYYTPNPIYYTLTISAGYGGTTNPSPGTYAYAQGTPVTVTAIPSGNYQFSYWLLDGIQYTQNPITVMMNSNHNLQANFVYTPPQFRSLTVLAYNQYGVPGAVPLYIDGQYVGTTGYSYSVAQGAHQIYVLSPLYGGGYHLFYFYYYDGMVDSNNPTSIAVYSDKTVIAFYYSYYG